MSTSHRNEVTNSVGNTQHIVCI